MRVKKREMLLIWIKREVEISRLENEAKTLRESQKKQVEDLMKRLDASES